MKKVSKILLFQLKQGDDSEGSTSDSRSDGGEASSDGEGEDGEEKEGKGEGFKDSHRPRDESPNSRKVSSDIIST